MLLTHPRIHVWDRPNWTVAERLDEFRERLPCERQHRRASMRGLVLSLLCSTVHGGSTLSLSGSESSIVFGKDVSSAATLTASCGHKQPTFTLIKPNVLQGHTPGQTVVVLLGSVAPTCLVVADWRTTPCGVLPSDDLAVPPLFYCIYSGGAGSVSVGPIVANTTSVSHDGYYLGHSVRAHCPIPALGDLMRLGPYNGTQPSYKVELTLSYFSAEGDSAIPFEFAGAVGGNVVDFQNLPAPPPPSPPSFPPWSAAYQYEQWGATACSDPDATLLYSGFVAGADYNKNGGTSSYVCMHPDPQAGSGTSSPHPTLYGTEYERNPNDNGDAACAVCLKPRAADVYVQWGRGTSCSNGHDTLYSGNAEASGNAQPGRTTLTCVDKRHQVHSTSSSTNDNGALFYPVTVNSGSSDESQYPSSNVVGCSVCAIKA